MINVKTKITSRRLDISNIICKRVFVILVVFSWNFKYKPGYKSHDLS